MKIVTLLNQKGGVGKTSLCHHLSHAMAREGRRVLLIDNDPQSSLTQGLLGSSEARELDSVFTIDRVYGEIGFVFPDAVIRPTAIPGVDLLPGHRETARFNLPIPHQQEEVYQRALKEFSGYLRGYDVVLIDCPPNLHLCSWAALVASDFIVVPLQAEDYGAQGVVDIQESIEMVQRGPNSDLRLLGYVVNMLERRQSLHKLYEDTLRGLYAATVLDSTIPRLKDYPEAIAARKPVGIYKPRSNAAKAIVRLAAEVEARMLVEATPEAAIRNQG